MVSMILAFFHVGLCPPPTSSSPSKPQTLWTRKPSACRASRQVVPVDAVVVEEARRLHHLAPPHAGLRYARHRIGLKSFHQYSRSPIHARIPQVQLAKLRCWQVRRCGRQWFIQKPRRRETVKFTRALQLIESTLRLSKIAICSHGLAAALACWRHVGRRDGCKSSRQHFLRRCL